MSFIDVHRSGGRGSVALNTGSIASVRPLSVGDGSLIICVGGAVHRVDESYDWIVRNL